MRVYLPVNKAIRRGRLIVNLPGAILFLIFLVGVPSFILQYTDENWIIITGIVIGFAVGFSLGWIYSGFAVVRWQIWAYENVKNIHELKEKAIHEKIIYPDGHWSEKLNFFFRNYEQRQKLKQLERRFQSEDEYHDDLNVSKETAIYVSKKSIFLLFAFGLFFSGLAGYRYFIQGDTNAKWLSFFILICFGLAYNDYRKKEPEILISNAGIKLYKKELMTWDSITNEHIEIERLHDKQNKFLSFYYKDKEQRFRINYLSINMDELEHLLQIYRLRYDKNNA